MSWSVAQTIVRQLVSKVQDVDLIGALANEAPQTLDGIGCLNVSVHVLASTHKRSTGALRPQPGFVPLLDSVGGIWLVISGQLSQGLLFCRLRTLANEFSLDVAALASGDSREHIALFMRASSADEG